MNEDDAAAIELESARQQPRTKSRWRFRVAAIALALFSAVVLGEICVRLYMASRGWTSNCYVGGITLLVPDTDNGYTLAKHHRFQSGVLKISTNGHGLRGPDVTTAKPQGTRRVAMIGGSSVFGYLVSDGEEAARQLESRLTESGDDNVEVLNAGVPGYNVIQSWQRYQKSVAPLEPDLVILYLGWNDLAYLLTRLPKLSVAEVARGPCAATWERWAAKSALYGLIVHRLLGRTASFAPPAHVGTTPTPAGTSLFRDTLARLVAEIRESGAEVIICSQATFAHSSADQSVWQHLGSTPKDAERTIRLGEWLRNFLADFAAENELTFVDVYNLIPPTETMLGDAIHLTRQGEERLAEILTRTVMAEWNPLVEE